MSKAPKKKAQSISTCMELMCDLRQPEFPFQKHVAWMVFNTWLRVGSSPDLMLQASAAATALVIQAVDEGVLKPQSHEEPALLQTEFRSYPLEELLLSPPSQKHNPTFADFSEIFEIADNLSHFAADLLRFFVRAPTHPHKPSLNRAIHFVEAGGFIDKSQPAADQASLRRSATSLKQAWVSRLEASPFFEAALEEAPYDFSDAINLPPDEMSSIATISDFLKEDDFGSQFLGTARYYQERLIERLDSKSLERFEFHSFPKAVEPVDPLLDGFDDEQLKLASDYKSQNWKI